MAFSFIPSDRTCVCLPFEANVRALTLFSMCSIVLPNLGVAFTMFLLALLGWLALRRAYAATVHAKFRARTVSILAGEKRLQELLGPNRMS